jgi:hypothetical protein
MEVELYPALTGSSSGEAIKRMTSCKNPISSANHFERKAFSKWKLNYTKLLKEVKEIEFIFTE